MNKYTKDFIEDLGYMIKLATCVGVASVIFITILIAPLYFLGAFNP